MLVGLARGIYTLIQATAITDRWGPSAYGTLNGLLMAPTLVGLGVGARSSAPRLPILSAATRTRSCVLAGLAALAAVLLLWASPSPKCGLSRAAVTVAGGDLAGALIWAAVNGKLTHCFLPNSSVWSFDHGEVGFSDWP